MKKKGITCGARSSNFELLRCIAMLMVLFQHLGDTMAINQGTLVWMPNDLYINFLRVLGTLGVNCFILISGYFMINQHFSTKKLFKLYLKIFLYGFFTFGILNAVGYLHSSPSQWIKALFPILSMKYWYISMYVGLLLFSPFLNKILNSLQKKDYFRMIVILGFLFMILSMISIEEIWVSRFTWFIYLYSIAAYIRLYSVDVKVNSGKCFFSFAVLVFGIWCSVVGLKFIGIYSKVAREHIYYFTANWYLPVFLASLSLFFGCKKIKRQSALINSWGKATFGIYILHSTVSPFEKLFHCSKYLKTALFVPYSIIVVVIVFLVCWLIDLLVDYVGKRFLYQIFDMVSVRIDVKILRIEKEIKRVLKSIFEAC